MKKETMDSIRELSQLRQDLLTLQYGHPDSQAKDDAYKLRMQFVEPELAKQMALAVSEMPIQQIL
jgi:elongation factor P--beta-lysine ligase